ncbi:winged helix-turn-helix transcriptional regulator [Streptomyces sp. PKU-EA00015]|uniref:helix-turn-helix transcriptional regulator n=1 Tax=Streptomyces sp. PKU-EA00015 TaxID=2748326 RepID=UPI0015A117BD|nr:winged helix-turn-helix domain-containing protein [Streptomyces sp. PKU-EA00015]NWF25557.1 winged helix-turn-helix transcriptional regulator [Streptomyces sp. PKU-EA00015]
METSDPSRSTWTFVTNHTRVLTAVARNPWIRIRDLASALDLTERTVQALLSDLEQAGYLTRTREGRRNRYQIDAGGKFRHPAEGDRPIAPLLELLTDAPGPLPHRTGDDEPGERDRSAD